MNEIEEIGIGYCEMQKSVIDFMQWLARSLKRSYKT